MCSIIGYIGFDKAAPVLVQGLKRMEYRGYDSVGVATFSNNQILIKKGIGKVDQVNSTTKLDALSGNIGIGHTRWATHGGVTSTNAHPHPSTSNKIAIVDRKSTRLNSSHVEISYAVFCLKKKKNKQKYTKRHNTSSYMIKIDTE